MASRVRIGDTVRVATAGTKAFPVPQRYQGRTATVVGRRRQGASFIYMLDFGARRATSLPVTSTTIQAL